MTTKRRQYTQEFKLEAISLVVEHKRKIPDVASSLGIGKSTLHKWLSQYRQEMKGQAPKVGNALWMNSASFKSSVSRLSGSLWSAIF